MAERTIVDDDFSEQPTDPEAHPLGRSSSSQVSVRQGSGVLALSDDTRVEAPFPPASDEGEPPPAPFPEPPVARPPLSDPAARPPRRPPDEDEDPREADRPFEPLRPGETVADRYTIVGSLGRGGMAEVYLAELAGAAGFTKTVVIKRILPGLVKDQRFVELFVREAHVASSLTHANVVQLYELGEDRGTYFIVMEYVRGMTLADLARRAWRLGRSLPLELLLLAVADAAEGLSYGWRTLGRDGQPFHLVHRDVSPDNLIINAEGTTKVLDYGIAKGAGSANLTQAGELKGKIAYVPPEEIQGRPRDHRSDLYALGLSLYWLCTRRMAFEIQAPSDLLEKVVRGDAPPPRAHNPALPPEVDALIRRLMAKDPDERFADGQELVDAVLHLLGAAARRGPSAAFVDEMMRRAMEADDIAGVPEGLVPAAATTEALASTGYQRGPGTLRRLALKLFGRD